ncbi:MAG: 4Fe-4S binding protein, partial [Methylococcales bacterium]|nr:4Fe-4S binding protein [Methylococcales bacterium]
YWLLFGVLALSATSGSMVWELVNPVSGFQRGILSGLSSAWAIGVGIFLLDVFIGKNLWCGHLCPTGAFYAQINTVGLLRVKAPKQAECDDCGDCYRVCPEPQILPPVLKGDHPLKVVGDSVCTNCGRCIEVCDRAVFQYGVRPFGKS